MTKADFDLLEKFLSGPVALHYPLDTEHRLLHYSGYIRGIEPALLPDGSHAPTKWAITDAGILACRQFKEEAEQKAEQKRQQRFENKVSVANVLIPIATLILGMMFEHFTSIWGILRNLLN